MAKGTAGGTAALKESLKKKGVRYLLPAYVDMHGICKAKTVPIEHLDRMMKGSELYTGAALDGVPQEVNDDEVASVPDPETCMILPWNREVAYFAADLWYQGKPFEACSRTILKRQLAEAAKMGYVFNLGVETEFFVLRENEKGELVPVSEADTIDKTAYDIRLLLHNYSWLDEVVSAMNELGWDVYSFDHEDTNGQFETDFMYADALTMADRVTFFRLMVKEIARNHGLIATFMPKPWPNRTGSGAHYNMSFADKKTGRNLFESKTDKRKCGLSEIGYYFIGGVLKHADAICAVTCPLVNSYKRLVKKGSMSGFTWAPIFACYGGNNRTNMLRIPLGGGRVECRATDISGNLYLGAAMMLAAGLEGLRKKIDPSDPHMENMYLLSDEEREKRGVGLLPRTLEEALDAFEADPLSKQVFGAKMFKAWLEYKRNEWDEFYNHVSDWERRRYISMF